MRLYCHKDKELWGLDKHTEMMISLIFLSFHEDVSFDEVLLSAMNQGYTDKCKVLHDSI